MRLGSNRGEVGSTPILFYFGSCVVPDSDVSECHLGQMICLIRGVQRAILPPPRLRPAYKLGDESRRGTVPEKGVHPRVDMTKSPQISFASMAELADALALGASDRKIVGVQIPLLAPNLGAEYFAVRDRNPAVPAHSG